jgi:hypothetical protein
VSDARALVSASNVGSLLDLSGTLRDTSPSF